MLQYKKNYQTIHSFPQVASRASRPPWSAQKPARAPLKKSVCRRVATFRNACVGADTPAIRPPKSAATSTSVRRCAISPRVEKTPSASTWRGAMCADAHPLTWATRTALVIRS